MTTSSVLGGVDGFCRLAEGKELTVRVRVVEFEDG